MWVGSMRTMRGCCFGCIFDKVPLDESVDMNPDRRSACCAYKAARNSRPESSCQRSFAFGPTETPDSLLHQALWPIPAFRRPTDEDPLHAAFVDIQELAASNPKADVR